MDYAIDDFGMSQILGLWGSITWYTLLAGCVYAFWTFLSMTCKMCIHVILHHKCIKMSYYAKKSNYFLRRTNRVQSHQISVLNKVTSSAKSKMMKNACNTHRCNLQQKPKSGVHQNSKNDGEARTCVTRLMRRALNRCATNSSNRSWYLWGVSFINRTNHQRPLCWYKW